MGADISRRIKELRQARADAHSAIDKISEKATAENRPLSADEKADIARFEATFDEAGENLTIAQKHADRQRTLEPVVDDDAETARTAAETAQNKPVAGFAGPTAYGDMLKAVHHAAQPDGHADKRLFAAATGMNESVGSEGGFLVQSAQTTQIRDRIYMDDYMLTHVTRIPLGPNTNGTKLLGVNETTLANGQIYGGIQSYWVAEAGTKTPSQPGFREMDLKLKKVAALLYVTDELLQDAVALQAWAESRVPLSLRRKAAKAIYSGTGAGMPKGLTNSGAAITVAAENGQAAGTVTWANILAMWARMYPPSQANAVWLVDSTVLAQLYQMFIPIGTGGVPILQPANVAAGQLYPTLMGRPVVVVEYNQVVGTVGDIVLVDPTQYLWIDKGDVQTASSIHVRFINDETAFRFVWRVDGQLEWNSDLTPDNGGPTQSPVVMLATR
jgi:HK97 family phage major capsid protein